MKRQYASFNFDIINYVCINLTAFENFEFEMDYRFYKLASCPLQLSRMVHGLFRGAEILAYLFDHIGFSKEKPYLLLTVKLHCILL